MAGMHFNGVIEAHFVLIFLYTYNALSIITIAEFAINRYTRRMIG